MEEQKNIYRAFSTETLESMLRDMTLSEQDLDMDMLDAVMAELDRRQGAPETMDPEAALEVFRTEYAGEDSAYPDCAHVERETGKTKPRKKIGKRIFLVAAVVAVLLAGTLAAVQADGLAFLGRFLTVDPSGALTFNARSPDAPPPGAGTEVTPEESAFPTISPQWPPETEIEYVPQSQFDFSEGYRALEQFGTVENLVDAFHLAPEVSAPSYIPDGYELSDMNYFPGENWFLFGLHYRGPNPNLNSYISININPDERIEPDLSNTTTVTTDYWNYTFYSYIANGCGWCIWQTEHYSCEVYGWGLTREEALTIALSMYSKDVAMNKSNEQFEKSAYYDTFVPADGWPELPESLWTSMPNDYEACNVTDSYVSLSELLEFYQITPEINGPTYLPKGYKLEELSRFPVGPWVHFSAWYYQEGNQYSIDIEFHPYTGEGETGYGWDGKPVEEIEYDGKMFHVYSNGDTCGVVWMTEHFECMVAGAPNREEALKIAKSMYPE